MGFRAHVSETARHTLSWLSMMLKLAHSSEQEINKAADGLSVIWMEELLCNGACIGICAT